MSKIAPYTQRLAVANINLVFMLLPCYKWAPLICARPIPQIS